MKKGKLQRGLAMVLSAAMLLTGINYPSITAKAAETSVYKYDMEVTPEDGWEVEWSVGSQDTTNEKKAVNGTNNTGTAWNIWSLRAQKVTFHKTIADVEPGDYKASVEILGGAVSSGKIAICEGETEKGSKTMQIGTWNNGEADIWETNSTDICVVEGTSLTIVVEVDLDTNGWFLMDNVELKKVITDEAEKEAKKTELKTLLDACTALNSSDYQAASWAALQSAITDAQAVYDDAANKSLAEIQAAITALQAAKDALVDANLVENAGIIVDKVEGITDDFIRGVDISTYISLIDSGVKFKGWNGEELDDVGFFQLLKEAGVNYVRIRVWNDPYKDAEKKQGYGAGNCDVEKAARMGAWATQAGLKVLIDFHYSDFWADPGRQIAPKAWKDYTVEQKADAITTFTKESLNKIIAAGTNVRMVQVGNETTAAICGEKDWANMATLFKAGCAAVKSVDPTILRAIHFTNPEKSSNMKGYAENLSTYGVDYDVFASSYYPYWHGTLTNLTQVLSDIATTYNKKVMVAETSWAHTMEDGDGQPNVVRKGNNDDTSVYAATPQGQAYEVRDVIDAVAKVGEAGIGVMYWEPAWLPVNVYHADAENAEQILAANHQAWETYGSGWASSHSIGYDTAVNKDNYGGSEWDNQAMFDFEGNPLPSLNVFKYVLTGATEPKKLDAIADSSIDVNFGENVTDKLPATVDGIFNDKTKAENLPVVWNQDDIKAITGFGEFYVKGTVTYQTEGGQTETMNTVCTVNVAPENMLEQGDFEDGRDKWKIEGTGINSKTTENPRSGQYCLAFYLGSDYELTATQSMTVETPGIYSAFMYLQGGDEGKVTANIKLSNDTQNTSSDADASVKGWKVWQNPNTEDIKAAIGDTLTVTITVNGKAASWGSVDDIYLYLKQADPVYQVIYHMDNGDNAEANPVKFDGTKTIVLADPSREGYSFKGWYTDSEFKNKITEIAKGTAKNLDLYAKWEKITVAPGESLITYKLNGGTNHADNPAKYTEGQALQLKDPSREGYTFKGWYTDSECKNEFAGITSETKGNLTLYAKWEKEQNPVDEDVKVTKIKLNTSSKKLLRGSKFTLKVTEVLPEDATEKDVTWSTSNKKVATVKNGVVTAAGPGEAVITATAKDGSGVKAECKITVPYKITYKLNKGTNHKSNPSTYYQQKITLKNPTRKGYIFKGWYTDSKFKKKITSIAKTSKKDITLYAKWSKVTVKKASLKKVTNVSGKKAKVTINKVSGAKGYQICYSTDKKFKKNVKNVLAKKTTYTITKLQKKKTYYVKVRAYKLDSKGEKVFGSYSKVKTVKIKK